MAWQEEFLLKLGSPPGLNKPQIQLLVRAVDFIADDRMARTRLKRSPKDVDLVKRRSTRNSVSAGAPAG